MELFIISNLNSFFHIRSTSPKSKDSKIKREKDVKIEEEDQDEKKKEKVPILEQFNCTWLVYVFVSFFSLNFYSVSGSAIVSGGVAG